MEPKLELIRFGLLFVGVRLDWRRCCCCCRLLQAVDLGDAIGRWTCCSAAAANENLATVCSTLIGSANTGGGAGALVALVGLRRFQYLPSVYSPIHLPIHPSIHPPARPSVRPSWLVRNRFGTFVINSRFSRTGQTGSCVWRRCRRVVVVIADFHVAYCSSLFSCSSSTPRQHTGRKLSLPRLWFVSIVCLIVL